MHDAGFPLTAEALREIVTLPVMTGIDELYLSQNSIGAEEARALAQATHLRHLQSLVLNKNDLSHEAQGLLRRHFGARVHL